MLITTLGDLLLDVIASLDEPLAHDDDRVGTTLVTAGGQAANVAAWAASLGASARLVTKRGDDSVGTALHDPSCRQFPERLALALDREDEVGRERRSPFAERVVDQRPRREVERDLRAGRPRQLARTQRRRRDRLPHQRVPRHVQSIAAEPVRLELLRPELRRRAAVGDHRSLAGRGDRDHDAGPSARRPDDVDAASA